MNKNKKILKFFNFRSELSKITLTDMISSGSGALFWLFFASILSTEEYGEIIFYISIAGMISSLSMIGASNSLIVLTSKKIPIESTVNLFSLLAGVFGLVITTIFYEKIEIGLLAISYISTNLIIWQFLGKKKTNHYLIYSLLNKFLIIIFSLVLYYFFGNIGIILGLSISTIIFGKKIISDFQKIKIDFNLYRKNLKFILSSSITDIGNSVTGSMDKIIIVPLLGFSVLAGYQIGLQFCTILIIIPNIIYKITLSDDARGEKNTKLKIYSILLVTTLTLIGITFTSSIIPIINYEYLQFELHIQIIMMGAIPIAIKTMLTSEFVGKERNRIMILNSIIHSVCLILLIIYFGQYFGDIGICVGFLLTQCIVCALNLALKIKKFDDK